MFGNILQRNIEFGEPKKMMALSLMGKTAFVSASRHQSSTNSSSSAPVRAGGSLVKVDESSNTGLRRIIMSDMKTRWDLCF
jgi:hypothetical protein